MPSLRCRLPRIIEAALPRSPRLCSLSLYQRCRQQGAFSPRLCNLVPPAARPFSTKMDRSEFTQLVVDSMRSLYPEELADRSWDNVGLLLDNMENTDVPRRVLLTNDLTPEVAEEAMEMDASVIVTYHPIIFRGLKAITLDDPQQNILLRLARANVAVYSPHTAVDAAPGGLNDWLADLASECRMRGVPQASRTVLKRVAGPLPEGLFAEGEGAGGLVGYGRLVRFARTVPWRDVVRDLAYGLGVKHVMVAAPQVIDPDNGERVDMENAQVSSVAVCAGAGWDVLKDCDADMLVTGEVSHHNALHAAMLGKWVVTVLHSNSERQFLSQRMQPRLTQRLAEAGVEAEVLVSSCDADPFEIVSIGDLGK